MRELYSLCLGFFFASPLAALPPMPTRPESLPVLITIPIPGTLTTNGTIKVKFGSGFYLSDGTNVFFVTAHHVLFGYFGSTNLLGPVATTLSHPSQEITGVYSIEIPLQALY